MEYALVAAHEQVVQVELDHLPRGRDPRPLEAQLVARNL
jgi:hypothetical protein